MKKSAFGLLVLPVLTLLAATAAAQGIQAPKHPAPVPENATTQPATSGQSRGADLFPMPVIPADADTSAQAAPTSSVPSGGAELFPMPVIPADADTSAQAAPTSSVPSGGAELFPMPVIPADADTSAQAAPADDDSAPALPAASSSASLHGAELFSTPAIPEDPPAPPLTPAELEMQALIQNAIGKDPTVTGGSVNVAISAGGIELTGNVTSMRARLAASRLAK